MSDQTLRKPVECADCQMPLDFDEEHPESVCALRVLIDLMLTVKSILKRRYK